MERAARSGWRHVFYVLLYALFTRLSRHLLTAETPAWPVNMRAPAVLLVLDGHHIDLPFGRP